MFNRTVSETSRGYTSQPAQLSMLVLLILLLATSPSLAEIVIGTPRIVDGDTLEIGSTTIRLHGIDAPEVSQPGGREAIVALVELVNNKAIQCEGHEKDDYERLIAKCRMGDEDINAAMVRRGWAWAFAKYSSDYLVLEQQAREAKHGN